MDAIFGENMFSSKGDMCYKVKAMNSDTRQKFVNYKKVAVTPEVKACAHRNFDFRRKENMTVLRDKNKIVWLRLKNHLVKQMIHLYVSIRCFNVVKRNILILITLSTILPFCHTCYVFPPGMKNLCEEKTCEYNAICKVDVKGGVARCQCRDNCYNYGDNAASLPICGSNGKDYNNFCELQRDSCLNMVDIWVDYYGRCDPCDGVKCSGYQVCKVGDNKEPVCKCETACEPVVSAVCGSDRQTYSNVCMLRQQACELGRDILVLYEGKCKGEDGHTIGFKDGNL
ncbi:hypothetical protein ACF0H5_019898 [Mactra antiquata]